MTMGHVFGKYPGGKYIVRPKCGEGGGAAFVMRMRMHAAGSRSED
jgi:hypothetical protein